MRDAPTTDQIRDAIDSGKTGEKVGFPDPAAAPLGTDAEAGGNPPTKLERLTEAIAQTRHEEPRRDYGVAIYLTGIVIIGILVLVVDLIV